jgi:hypothetical protein
MIDEASNLRHIDEANYASVCPRVAANYCLAAIGGLEANLLQALWPDVLNAVFRRGLQEHPVLEG